MNLTIDHLMRARLRALIVRHWVSIAALSEAMGHSRTWLRRKIDRRTKQPRPVTLEDIDEVLAYLGEPVSALLAPVWLPGMRPALQLLAATPSTPEDFVDHLHGDGVVDRLVDQRLVDREGDLLLVTPLARAWADLPCTGA